MDTNVQSDEATQNRRAKTKWKKQTNAIHHPRNYLMGIDQPNGFRFMIHLKISKIVPRRRPKDNRKRFDEPVWGVEIRWYDKASYGGNDLKRDCVHIDWNIRSEKSRSALVAVEEGWSNIQNIHKCWWVTQADWATIRSNREYFTWLIGVRGRNRIGWYK